MEHEETKRSIDIYCITNTVNGKRYIGQTITGVKARWRKHVWLALTQNADTRFCAAIRKHGRDSFKLSTLQSCEDFALANDAERHWVQELMSNDPKFGYNMTDGGDQKQSGWKMSPEACAKISASKLGKPLTARRLRTQEEDRPIIELFKTGITRLEIQQQLGVTPAKVQKALQRWKDRVDPSLKVGSENQYKNSGRSLQERRDRETRPIIDAHLAGDPNELIAERLNLSIAHVSGALRRAQKRELI